MALPNSKQRLIPSIFDRLIDNAPDSGNQAPENYGQTLDELYDAVKRDLENLLNSRRSCEANQGFLKKQELMGYEIVNCGLPDFFSMNLSHDEGRKAFQQILENTIDCYEPRLTRVKVHLLENADQVDRTLRFRIEGTLLADSAPEQIVFDSTLEPITSNFTLKSSNYG